MNPTAWKVLRFWLAIPTLLMAALGWPLQAAASNGTTGVYTLIDTVHFPGVRCGYEYESSAVVLHSFRVRRPIVFAMDTTSGEDRQMVGWRFRIQESVDGGKTWILSYKGSPHLATATDSQPAAFKPDRVRLNQAADSRVIVAVSWYDPVTGALSAKAEPRVHWYALAAGGTPIITRAPCPGNL